MPQTRLKCWGSTWLTAGSKTSTVPAVTLMSLLSEEAIEKVVQRILEKQQQPPANKPHTKKCLSCGQPKSKYEGDGSSIHEFYQPGPTRYFYCSTKVYNTYRTEGLTNSRMPFRDFMDTEFCQRELEATQQRVNERQEKKRKRDESPATGRKCGFCKLQLKQGPVLTFIHNSLVCQENTSTALPKYSPCTRTRGWRRRCSSSLLFMTGRGKGGV